MSKKENTKNIILGILLVGLVSMTVVYAALSQTLNIGGIAKVQRGSQTWNIYFDNLSTGTPTGGATVVNDLQITGTTTLSNLTASFANRGDSVTYTFDVVNDGEVDAKIENINLTDFANAIYDSESNQDKEIVRSNLQYSLTYTSNGTALDENDIIRGNSSVNVTFKITFNPQASSLPNNDVYISGVVTHIDYVQN